MRYGEIIGEVTAYHGTPHSFSQFSSDRIGSGEGNQAEGWGLYFAGRKEVAEWYRRVLTAAHAMGITKGYRMITDPMNRIEREVMPKVNQRWTEALKNYGLDSPRWMRDIITFSNAVDDVPEWDAAYYAQHRDEIERKIAAYEHRYETDPAYRARMHEYMGADWTPSWSHLRTPYANAYDSAAQELTRQLEARGYTGALHEVEIPGDDEYLLWDAPMSDQPAPVKAALEILGRSFRENETGAQFYRALAKELGSQKDASLRLLSVGIAGVRYLDGSSRKDGEGTYNYVVFDDNRITRKAESST